METTFSMTRVQHIMRRDLIENWKSNLYGLLGIFAACFFPMLGFLWSAERWTEEGYPEVYSFERFCSNLWLCGMEIRTQEGSERRRRYAHHSFQALTYPARNVIFLRCMGIDMVGVSNLYQQHRARYRRLYQRPELCRSVGFVKKIHRAMALLDCR